jgi:predicted dehydrogenase
MKRARWGIIGPGTIAHQFANDIGLLESPQIIQAVLGHSKKHTEEFANEFGIPQVFTNLEEFIEKAKIDIAYIASPHTLHYEQALACLRNKIPVLCEKPMAINLDQCNELIAASREHTTFLMEGLWIRFLPSVQLLLNIIEKGEIGRILSIKASMNFKAPYDPKSRLFDPDLGGGSLLDLGIYPIFLALLLLGKPDTIKAIGTLSDQGIDEDCSILFHYKSGQRTILESSLVNQTQMPAEITGEKGTIRILHPWFEKAAGIEVDLYDDGKTIYPCQWPGHGLQFEAAEALKCISANKIASEQIPHVFSQQLITIMDEIRRQIHVNYEMYE